MYINWIRSYTIDPSVILLGMNTVQDQSHNESEKEYPASVPLSGSNRVYSGLSLSFVENPFSSSCGILLTPTNKHEWTQDLLFTEVKKKKKNPKNNVNKLYLLNRLGANLVG